MFVTVFGILMDIKLSHRLKAILPIVVTLGIYIVLIPEKENAALPMFVVPPQ